MTDLREAAQRAHDWMIEQGKVTFAYGGGMPAVDRLNGIIAALRSALSAAPQAEPSLLELNEMAKVYASNYASPHHIVFTVEGLRSLFTSLDAAPPAQEPPVAGVRASHPDEIGVDEYIAQQDPATQKAIADQAEWAREALGVQPTLTPNQEQALRQTLDHLRDEEGKSHQGYFSVGWAGEQLRALLASHSGVAAASIASSNERNNTEK
jgi:hypothetical protein